MTKGDSRITNHSILDGCLFYVKERELLKRKNSIK